MRLARGEDRGRCRDIRRPQIDLHVEAPGHFVELLDESIWRDAVGREVELDALEEHPLTGVADAVDVLFRMDDVAPHRGDEPGGGRDDARLVGTREQQDR